MGESRLSLGRTWRTRVVRRREEGEGGQCHPWEGKGRLSTRSLEPKKVPEAPRQSGRRHVTYEAGGMPNKCGSPSPQKLAELREGEYESMLAVWHSAWLRWQSLESQSRLCFCLRAEPPRW